jgi:hypothetical protein
MCGLGRLAVAASATIQVVVVPTRAGVFIANKAEVSAAGRKTIVNETAIGWCELDLGNSIRHRNWTLHLPAGAKLAWAFFPFNPYRNGPEAELVHAVGTLSIPLSGKQELEFAIEAD